MSLEVRIDFDAFFPGLLDQHGFAKWSGFLPCELQLGISVNKLDPARSI
jgi:hypothetical protein